MIYTVHTPDMLPLCWPFMGLDLGRSEITSIHSFKRGFFDLSMKTVVPHVLRSSRLQVHFTSVQMFFKLIIVYSMFQL